MQAHDGYATRRPRSSTIQDVPLIRGTVVAGHVNDPRPHGVEAEASQVVSTDDVWRRTRETHQTISVELVLRPEPIPRQSTRSPGLIWSCTLASVIGTAAGPTLPYFG